tara:strand:- start:687 stop:1235 length:549 start_codon:yes stop_codon:yes gene_type:complete
MAKDTKTEEKVINAGKKLFGTRGYIETSMSDIAKEVGITKTSLYYFYKNKQDLYLTVLEEVHVQLEQVFTTEKKPSEKKDIEKLILKLIDTLTPYGALLDPIDPVHFDTKDPALLQVIERELAIDKKSQAYLKCCGVKQTKLASHTMFSSTQGYMLRLKYGIDDIKPKQFASYTATIITTNT